MDRRVRRRIVPAVLAALVLGLVPAVAPTPVIAATGSGYSWAMDGGFGGAFDRHGSDTDSTIVMSSSSTTTAFVQVTTIYAETFRFELSSGSEPTTVGAYTVGDAFGSAITLRSVGSTSCVATEGSFTVLEIAHDGGGHVTNLAAHLTASCFGQTTAVADLRFHSAEPYPGIDFQLPQTFPTTPATATSTKDVTVESRGTGPLTISSVTIGGPYVSDFAIDDETCTAAPIAAGSSCTVTVAWTAKPYNETVSIFATSDSARAQAGITAFGPSGSPLTAPAPTFPDTLLNTATDPATVVVTNAGTQSFHVNSATVLGLGAGDFMIAEDACTGATLAPAATCSLDLIAVPTSPWEKVATLDVSVGSPYLDLEVNLRVTGFYRAASGIPSSIHNASADYTSTAGNALARTVSNGTAFLHAIVTASRVGSTTVKDAGPYAPIDYTRGNASGSTWTSALRLNATTQHGIWPGIAAADASVYASWVKVPKVVSFSSSAARSIQFRANSNHGTSTAWSTVKTLTSATGRVDYPAISAAGSGVYVAYTDANTGTVHLLISRDRGATWSNVSLGTTSATSSLGGKTGLPTVAASGNLVIVGWIADGNGAVKARISQDAGAHWNGPVTLASASLSYPSAAATPNRAGIAWIGADPMVAVWTVKGRWAGPFDVPNGGNLLEEMYGPALVLTGWSTVGVGYSGCVQICSTLGSGTILQSYYAESPSNGADWYQGDSFAVATGSDGRRGNDGLSAIASTPTTRDFLFTFWQPGTSTQRVVHRSITITPTDPATHVITPRRPDGPAVTRTTENRLPPFALRTRQPFRSS